MKIGKVAVGVKEQQPASVAPTQSAQNTSVADAIRAIADHPNPCEHGYGFNCNCQSDLAKAALARAEALEALVPVAEAILYHSDSGRTETRWTAKDGLTNAGDIANCDNLRAALRRVREASW